MGSGRGLPHISGDSYDSEDDRPEALTLEEAKSSVQKRRFEERAARRSLASKAKEARRRQSQRKEEETTASPPPSGKSSAVLDRKDRRRKRKTTVKQVEAIESPSANDGPADSVELLPPEVLKELAEKERLDNIHRVAARQETQQETRIKTRRKQIRSSEAVEGSNGVQVVVLGSEKPMVESFTDAAANYQKERLYGAKRKRSHSMLASPFQAQTSFV